MNKRHFLKTTACAITALGTSALSCISSLLHTEAKGRPFVEDLGETYDERTKIVTCKLRCDWETGHWFITEHFQRGQLMASRVGSMFLFAALNARLKRQIDGDAILTIEAEVAEV